MQVTMYEIVPTAEQMQLAKCKGDPVMFYSDGDRTYMETDECAFFWHNTFLLWLPVPANR